MARDARSSRTSAKGSCAQAPSPPVVIFDGPAAFPTALPLLKTTLATILLAATILSACGRSARGSDTGSSGVAVPVVRCPLGPDSRSVSSTPPLPGPSPASTASIARLSLFSDGFVSVLAPRGWRVCQGGVGFHGEYELTVYSTTGESRGIVTVMEERASLLGRPACALFNLHLPSGFCRNLPKEPAKGELVSHPSAGVAIFVDPPGLFGTGNPSGGRAGGRATSIGAVSLATKPTSSSKQITCLIPGSDHELCGEIISNYFGWNVMPQLPS
jgi:hypothetical protein